MRKRFLADSMLKNVWRWLRLLGVDCEFADALALADDEGLVRHCMRSRRVLLTRDAGLYASAKDHVKVVLVAPGPVERQVASIFRQFGLKPASLLEKCPKCGGKTVAAKNKHEIKQLVFPAVYAAHRQFWQCSSCGAVYWKGSHWPGLRKKMDAIRREVGAARPKHAAGRG